MFLRSHSDTDTTCGLRNTQTTKLQIIRKGKNMRKKGANCDFTCERNEKLLDMFRECLRESGCHSVVDIFQKMSKMPVPRFYINEQRATTLIREKWKRGDWNPRTLNKKLEMIKEIERRVVALMQADPELSLAEAVDLTVHSEAPSLYMTPRSIRTIYYNTKQARLQNRERQIGR